MRKVIEPYDSMPVIVLADSEKVPLAVKAMQMGALALLAKPCTALDR